ncbi:MAG: hypothetical protein ABI759_32180 [Candidatus Solibacter sp.]
MLKVTPFSVHALVTCEMSTPPAAETLFTKNVIVALLTLAAVNPAGSALKSN